MQPQERGNKGAKHDEKGMAQQERVMRQERGAAWWESWQKGADNRDNDDEDNNDGDNGNNKDVDNDDNNE